MKRLFIIGISGFAFISNIAEASVFDGAIPYLGIDYKYQNMEGKGDWEDILPNNYHNFGAHFGIKFPENFGLEVGYAKSLKESSEKTFSVGDTVFGTTLTAGQSATLKSKVTLKNYYIDINGYWKMSNNFDLLGTLGIGRGKAKIQDNGSSGTPTSLITEMQNVDGHHRFVPRVGIGAEYKFKSLAFRGRFLWEGTQNFRAKNVSPNVPKKYADNSYSFSLGVSYLFL